MSTGYYTFEPSIRHHFEKQQAQQQVGKGASGEVLPVPAVQAIKQSEEPDKPSVHSDPSSPKAST